MEKHMHSKRPLKMIQVLSTCGDEKGMVFIVVVALIAVLALVGTMAVLTTTTDIIISGNHKTSVTALYAAEAGVEEARARLRGASSGSIYAGDPAASPNGSWTAYILTSTSWQTSDDPKYNSAYTNYIPTTSNHTNTGIVINSLQTNIPYWIKIKHKREYDAEQAGHATTSSHYYDGDGSTATHTAGAPGNIIYYGYKNPSTPTTPVQFTTTGTTAFKPVDIITAYGESGNSLKRIEIEVVRYPGPPIVAPLYTKDDTTINGSSGSISGNDNCGMAPAIPPVYTLAPYTVTNNPAPTYSGNPATPVSGPIDLDILGYINALKNNATITITADQNGTNYGSASNFVTCYSDTSNPPNNQGLEMQNLTGYGTLLVKGDLKLGGGFRWYGLVLCTGTLTLNGGGTGINIDGAAMSVETIAINGGLNIRYDSCNINNALNTQSMKVIKWKEIY